MNVSNWYLKKKVVVEMGYKLGIYIIINDKNDVSLFFIQIRDQQCRSIDKIRSI